MAKRTRKPPIELWRTDLAAFAVHLGIDLAPYPCIVRNIRTLDCEAWRTAIDTANPHHVAQDEAARWQQAEELLWLAATREAEARRDEAIRTGKLRVVRTGVGMSWKPRSTPVIANIVMDWDTRVSDLFDHPAVRAAMPSGLHSIIRDVLILFLKERKELDELRVNPDPKRIKALAAHADAEGMPDTAQGIVQRLADFVAATERQGESKAQSKRSRKGRKELPGDPPTTDDQDDAMRNLKKRYPTDRPVAVKKFAAEFKVTTRQASKVAARIGWPGRSGRPTGGKEKRNAG